ncbi:MAG: site-2 protease family protein [Actinomycetota bacterium]
MSENVRFALYLAAALLPSLVLHELAHSFAAVGLGDPSPRRWGRLTLNPKPIIDPLGSIILPALALILIASGSGFLLPVFAYAKPMAIDPSYLRNRRRDLTIVVLAGLGANLALAAIAGLGLRFGMTGEGGLVLYAILLVNVYMFAYQLMPVPGLDGSKLLAPVLPPRAREVYMNLDPYLPLFILVLFFVLAAPLVSIADAIAGLVCDVVAGPGVC